MAEEPAHLVLNIDFKQPLEIGDFVAGFVAVGEEFERFVRGRFPDLKPRTDMFVREIRQGSIDADLIPYLGSIVPLIEHAAVIQDFIRYWGERLLRYFNVGGRIENATRSELSDLLGAVTAIAKDPDASSTLQAVVFEDGRKKIKAAFKFDTAQARRAADQIEQHRRELERGSSADFTRVLMTFVQSNIKDTGIGRRTGEWVLVEGISDRPLPLVYASELAEQRIKYETREAEDNLYKKGFVVDVNVQTRGARPVAYRVMNVHQVIDLPDDDE